MNVEHFHYIRANGNDASVCQETATKNMLQPDVFYSLGSLRYVGSQWNISICLHANGNDASVCQ